MSNKLRPHGVILTAADFQVRGKDVYINTRKTGSVPGMLLIAADFCGHCHRFMPTFNEISDSLGKGYTCASIEHNALQGQDQLVSALSFQGYPTIKFFDQSGKIISEYQGERNKSNVLQHICKVYHHCIMK